MDRCGWTDDVPRGLEDPPAWDSEAVQRHLPVPNAGVQVTVGFDGAEFEAVSDRAERAGMRVTEYIRAAALGLVEN